MATNVAGIQTRQDPRPVLNVMTKRVNYNDPGIDTGLPFAQWLPQGARLIDVQVEIITAFNAATTNVLTAGIAAGYTDIVAAGDVPEGAVGVTKVPRALGRGVTAAAAGRPYAKYTQTGTAATAGQADITLTFDGGFSDG